MILTSPSLRLEIEPAWGGGFLRFDWIANGTAVPLMRAFDRASAAPASSAPDPNRLACYPLIPWSGRVSGGGFSVGARRVELALNRNDERWPIHGSGWQRAWRVESISTNQVSLTLEETATDGYCYRASLRYALDDRTLAVTLSATNTGTVALPFGLGLHPFFPRHGDARLRAPATGVWRNDGRTPLPVERTCVPLRWNFARDSVLPDGLDHSFDGWSGQATIRWPQCGLRMDIDADVDRYIVYVPAQRDFFCFEPVDHTPDAMNLPGGAVARGMTLLAPEQTLARRFCLRASAES
ncbi:MAG: aldose 1-epimerase [Proteobacteria bacterium]|nr:aldose 1-epimerase [Pseudomonadota bacterium]